MKKLRVLLVITIISISFMMYGCEKKENSLQQEETQEETKKELVREEGQKDIDEETEENSENTNNTISIKKMKIYYVDDDTAEIVSKEIENENVTPEFIWSQLKKEGILSEECGLNSFTVNEAEKKLDMDVDSGFGNYIRSMGTAGEEEVITCLTRSYLETYGSVGIRVTEDGNVLETGHAILDGYMENLE